MSIPDQSLIRFSPLHEGVLIKRYKRFLADVRLENGDVVTAHCANTGPMKGVLVENGRIRLSYNPSPKRKLSWTWEQSQVVNDKGITSWVGINTAMANKIIFAAIEAGLFFNQLGAIECIRKEVVYGVNRKSRVDFLLIPDRSNPDPRNIYLEVKNTTWTKGRLALFPDTITQRGQKHLKELTLLVPESRSVLIPCISRIDVDEFAPGDEADKEYGDLFRLALKSGVEVIPSRFDFHRDCITWQGVCPLKCNEINK